MIGFVVRMEICEKGSKTQLACSRVKSVSGWGAGRRTFSRCPPASSLLTTTNTTSARLPTKVVGSIRNRMGF